MQLIMSHASPFARKVRVLLRESGLLDQVEEVPVATTALRPHPEAVAANPTGKIPALVRDEGPALYDSRVICRYLDARSGGGLYPESRIWEVLTLEALSDTITEAALAMVYEARFKGTDGKSGEWIEAQWGKVERGLAAIESQWMSHLSGRLNMGQVAVGCMLGYLDFRHADRDWRSRHSTLAAWSDRFATRESMEATRPVDA